jgi:hypothetical protein
MQEAKRKWRLKNLEYAKEYRDSHVDEFKVYDKKRNSLRTGYHPIVPWTERKEIKLFYLACPEGFHVDHIIPRNGDSISGLHVLNNLQYLPAQENRLKGNKESHSCPI